MPLLKSRSTWTRAIHLSCALGLLFATPLGAAPKQEAARILAAAGVRGGLVVHLGCGDGTLTAALRANERYLVHGLDPDAAHVAAAREHVRAQGLYGAVSVERWAGRRLPHTDNLVNLLVSEDLRGVPMAEVLRVLAPNGVAYVKANGTWEKTVKPRPSEIDEWTHFLHGPDNNAVARDTVVGPPRHIQWAGAPKWARAHEQLASVSALVAGGGRLFYIIDEGPTASIALPARWMLVARDAFNGVVLWKKPVGVWEGHMRGFRSGPSEVSRRLVAVNDRVYVTLAYREPVIALDAATGQAVKTYEGTDGALEIVCHDGVLFLVLGDMAADKLAEAAKRRSASPAPRNRRVLAIQADSGKLLWKKADADTTELMPTTLAASGGHVFFQSMDHVVCLDAKGGREAWRAPRPVNLNRQGWSAPTLVVHDDVVLSADRAAAGKGKKGADRPKQVQWTVTSGGGGGAGELIAFSAKTGQRLWSCKCTEGYNSPVDVFVASGLVWVGATARRRGPDFTAGRDLHTGEIKKRIPTVGAYANAGMPHHRCYRNKATERYIVEGRAGAEFIDLVKGGGQKHHWVRGACQYGIMPCNGLLYAPPHACACFYKAKLSGFYAVAPRRPAATTPSSAALERGPAFGKLPIPLPMPPRASEAEWPTYRHDAARSGATRHPVAPDLAVAWRADLGGRLSAPVVSRGTAYVAAVDAHTIVALNTNGGAPRWRFVAGGRVDSPPTIAEGLVFFGCADGYVYCLRAGDGQLVWRYRAAPEDRRVVFFGQLESAWPVHGSVLVQGGVVYAAAGRSSFLDGGIVLYRLDAASGKKLSETRVYSADPKTDQQPDAGIRGFEMPGALPDVLSSQGDAIYMRHVKFDRYGKRQADTGLHLFTPTGFLDGTWFHRAYWVYGPQFQAGWGAWWRVGHSVPSGRILVLGDQCIYGFGRDRYPGGNSGQWRDGEKYHLFAAPRSQPKPSPPKPKAPAPKGQPRRRRRAPVRSTVHYTWAQPAPLEVRAMVLAGDTLFVAGPPPDAHTNLDSFQGRGGVVLRAIAAADGKTLAEHKLAALPVFDGMIAARGRLFIALSNGSLLCMGKQ